MHQSVWRILLLGWLLSLSPALSIAGGLPHAEPESVGLDGQKLQEIDKLVEAGIVEKKMPGCVVCLVRRGKIGWLKAYGRRQIEPAEALMTVDTVFDLASLTKPVATATSIMRLVEAKKIKLTDKIADLIPDFGVNDKGEITVEDLLLHQSGLLPDNALADYQNSPAVALERICALKLQAPTRTKFIYSDVNFILLGELVKQASGQPLDEYARTNIFMPLGMTETGFLPSPELRARAAPTEQREGRWMQGEVHDPRAYKLGGVAGHAGLFSTAEDLALYANAMLHQGQHGDVRILSPETFATMTRGYKVPGGHVSTGLRGLGWDVRTGFSTNRGEGFSDRAFGHGGFTGTVLWIDPGTDLAVIFLSNRVHPDGKGSVNTLAGKICTIAAEACQR